VTKTEIIKDLKKAMEFYQGLGFERLPLKKERFFRSEGKRPFKGSEPQKPGQEDATSTMKGPSKDTEKKSRALSGLKEEIGDCQRCRLSKGRTNIVFGEGSPDADLMFIGEGPGREEDLQARPFVGHAGKVLTSLIVKMGMRRDDVYIANIVKCRPPLNRDPEPDEIKTCSPFLEKQIEIIRPKVIVALGRVSAQRLIGSMIPISKLRGKFYDFMGIPLMPTFHPAYLIRNPKDKWLTWGDAQMVLEKLKQ
jgi:DNA polymerase